MTGWFTSTAQQPILGSTGPSILGQSNVPLSGSSSQATTLPWGSTAARSTGLFSGLSGATAPVANSGLAGMATMAGGLPSVAGAAPPTLQRTGAYFDTLLAKSKKQMGADVPMDEFPTLQVGLGDLRQQLRNLGTKAQDRPLDARGHYLLAASGVDPVTSLHTLGAAAVPEARPDRTLGTAVDVDTYLSNLQTKTTLNMISDALERSARDFDTFLEENVAMEWDAQRRRIYEHFGIKPRQDDGPAKSGGPSASTSKGFGRSRRSKAQGLDANQESRADRVSILGTSTFGRSVIGGPSKIGAHQTGFTDVERLADGSSPGSVAASDDRALRDRQGKLAEKVCSLNAARKSRQPYPILLELAEVENKSAEPHAQYVVAAYEAVAEMVGEQGPAESAASARERHFATMYLDDNANSANAIEMRKRILAGASRFLEKQFMREVEALISRHPHEARLGGRPDVVNKIKAYIRLRSARKDLVPDNTDLQQMQDEYVWAVVFYLLRSGHVSQAAQYVNDNSNLFRGIDRTFSTYLNNYAASLDRRLSNRKLQDRISSEYTQRYRNDPDNSIDPFRMACYKVIGRCDLANRNLDGLNTDINDWVWLQFNLAREGDRSVELASEAYGLSDLQASIQEIGQKHFPRTGSDDGSGSFGMFFFLQVLSGLFEDAVSYLYPYSYVDAVHFGLALAYHGLLRSSDGLTAAANELRSYDTRNRPQINFCRMLGYYTRDFRAADVALAVEYVVLICLNMDMPGEAGARHAAVCHDALRDLVLETREFSKLVGDVRSDGRRVPGLIEDRAPLIGLAGEDDFIGTVTLQAAAFAHETGRTTDAVLLYHLAGEYDTVVAIVSRALSEAISLEMGDDPMRLLPVNLRNPSTPGAHDGTPSPPARTAAAAVAAGHHSVPPTFTLAALDDPVELARAMMAIYDKDAMLQRKIQDQNRTACRVLLEMSTIKTMVEADQWAQSLDRIRHLDILPIDAKGDPSAVRNAAAQFASLAQPVAINVPNLLMWTVICCMRQREQLAGSLFSGNEGTRRMMMDRLRQITLDLTAYTSQLRYRLPPHLHEILARASAE